MTELRWLSLASGATQLPPPWECHDQDWDLRKPIPVPDECARFVLLEHAIEHFTHRDGLRILCELRRVLAPEGVLRLSFPDVCRIDAACSGYLAFLRGLGKDGETQLDAIRFIAAGSGHQSVWSLEPARQLLRACGFRKVSEVPYGMSNHTELVGVDRHHETSTIHVATYETTILEASK